MTLNTHIIEFREGFDAHSFPVKLLVAGVIISGVTILLAIGVILSPAILHTAGISPVTTGSIADTGSMAPTMTSPTIFAADCSVDGEDVERGDIVVYDFSPGDDTPERHGVDANGEVVPVHPNIGASNIHRVEATNRDDPDEIPNTDTGYEIRTTKDNPDMETDNLIHTEDVECVVLFHIDLPDDLAPIAP